MGSITSYSTEDGKRYRVRYRDPDRNSREKAGFSRKKDAEDYLANITVSALRGEYVNPKTAKSTIADLGDEWISNQTHLKPSSYAAQESAWRVHVKPVWGARRVGEITHSDVKNWVTKITPGRSATVVIRAYGVLAAILDVAVLDRRLTTNPARGVKLPRKAKKKRNYLTAAQVELLAANSGKNATLVYTLAYTGLRWGEATGIRIRSLDTLRRRIFVAENAVWLGARVVVGTPKTHEARSVPYPKFLSEPIALQCEGKNREGLVFGDGVNHQRQSAGHGGWFEHAVKRCQNIDPNFPKITPHDLRHTAASLAISAGANVKAVQRMLGHASAAMTLDTYADLFEDDLDDVSDRLDAARAESVVGFSWGLTASGEQKTP
ncbi:site-specific integrase [Cryobacterium sp. Hh11]|uniref:tyrosine-type recombinase/integrase n=1 Tax=Cryobacterium sp. Hh11 TaxID=2555868 RepID=UPI00106D23CD|nr:site-specific integrase [Cryobacterium sp. Hh11]TFD48720.1 site-specific integrase [Cryobacterium sp. Hh11]